MWAFHFFSSTTQLNSSDEWSQLSQSWISLAPDNDFEVETRGWTIKVVYGLQSPVLSSNFFSFLNFSSSATTTTTAATEAVCWFDYFAITSRRLEKRVITFHKLALLSSKIFSDFHSRLTLSDDLKLETIITFIFGPNLTLIDSTCVKWIIKLSL